MNDTPLSAPARWLADVVTATTTVLALTLGAVACVPAPEMTESGTRAAPPSEDPVPGMGEAPRLLLAGLPVKGRAPMTGYDRDLFGEAWTDDADVEFGRNGCDTRNDILRRDLESVTIRPGTGGCVVGTGILIDPYSDEEIRFTRGQETSAAVQIDHVVALADAWAKGAQQLDGRTRQNFANDPDNLLAVAGDLNQRKGAGDAATWLPPHRGFRCEYARRQITVKARYDLWVTEAERDALERQLDTCS